MIFLAKISYHCIILNFYIPNTNNAAWTFRDYQRTGNNKEIFKNDLKRTLNKIRVKQSGQTIQAQDTDIHRVTKALDKLSQRYSAADDDYTIGVRLPLPPWGRSVAYLIPKGGESIPPEMSRIVDSSFHLPNGTSRLGYLGADNHDYGHLITGFKIDTLGEARQVVFDMYFQHILRGFTAEEAIGLSLKPSLQLAKLACSRFSLVNNSRTLNIANNLVVKRVNQTGENWSFLRKFIHKKQSDTSTLLEKVFRTVLNEWTFPDGHDVNQVNKSLTAVEKYLKLQTEELSHHDPSIQELSTELNKDWLNDEEIKDIATYSLYCALKCLGHLSTLEPNIQNKTIQEVMDINHHFNMELFLKSTGFGTTHELKLPTYQEWRNILNREPNIQINDLLNLGKVK